MNYGQFKEILEEEGVTDDHEIGYIDIGNRELENICVFVNDETGSFNVQE